MLILPADKVNIILFHGVVLCLFTFVWNTICMINKIIFIEHNLDLLSIGVMTCKRKQVMKTCTQILYRVLVQLNLIIILICKINNFRQTKSRDGQRKSAFFELSFRLKQWSHGDRMSDLRKEQ